MKKITILGVKIDNLSLQEVLEESKRFVDSEHQHFIVTPNPEMLMAADQNDQLKQILNSADIAVADGVGLSYAARFQGDTVQRVTGVDLMWHLCEQAAENSWPIYLLGAGEGIAEEAAKNINEAFPNIHIVGAQSGGAIDDPTGAHFEIIEAIKSSGAKLLFVAFGHGTQETWIYSHLDELPHVKLAIGVGGAFDYIAGEIPRAPKWLQRLGLEWLYRLIQQPERFDRIITATIKFPLLVLKRKYIRKHD